MHDNMITGKLKVQMSGTSLMLLDVWIQASGFATNTKKHLKLVRASRRCTAVFHKS
jgi:hypothetical protein